MLSEGMKKLKEYEVLSNGKRKEVKNLNSAAKVSWTPLTHNFLFTCDESTSGQYRTDSEKFSLTMLQCPT